MDLDAGGGELLGGGDAGDAAADHHHRAVEERAPARQVAHVLQAGDGALHDLPRLDLRALGLVRVHSVSHTCVQMRPHTLGKGLGSLATR